MFRRKTAVSSCQSFVFDAIVSTQGCLSLRVTAIKDRFTAQTGALGLETRMRKESTHFSYLHLACKLNWFPRTSSLSNAVLGFHYDVRIISQNPQTIPTKLGFSFINKQINIFQQRKSESNITNSRVNNKRFLPMPTLTFVSL